MRGFSKAGKMFLVILLVMILASAGLLINTLVNGGQPTIAIIALVGSIGGFAMTYKTAVNERNAKEKEEESDNIEDESEDEEITDY